MSNGHVDPAQLHIDANKITWGDLKKLRKLERSDPDAALDFGDELIERAVGCPIDDLPAGDVLRLQREWQERLRESMSGAGGASAAPSLAASGVAESSTTAT
jgi:hypothetical protein